MPGAFQQIPKLGWSWAKKVAKRACLAASLASRALSFEVAWSHERVWPRAVCHAKNQVIQPVHS